MASFIDREIAKLIRNGAKIANGNGLFYGHLLAGVDKQRINNEYKGAVGISPNGRLTLYYNEDLLSKYNEEHIRQVFIHECDHLIDKHLIRCGDKDPVIWNLATDAVINAPLTALHEEHVTVEKLRQTDESLRDLRDGMCSEYYYEKLLAVRKKLEEKIKNGELKIVDDHGKWKESCKNSGGVLEHLAQQAVKQAYNKAKGNMTADMLHKVERMFKSTISWKQLLKAFFTSSRSITKAKTRKKRNKKYGVLIPGKKRDTTLTLVIIIDVSASVCNTMFTQFFAEIDKIAHDYDEILIMQADTEVKKTYEYRKGMEIERYGSGGTLYQQPLDEADKLGADAIIYFGDGDCWEDNLRKIRTPVLWAIAGDSPKPTNWGRFIRVKQTTA